VIIRPTVVFLFPFNKGKEYSLATRAVGTIVRKFFYALFKTITLKLTDLNVESELIPFFDVSLNRHSREALSVLFYAFPKMKEEAIERQQIISGFVANLSNIKALQSYKSDIEEAYEFCQSIGRLLPETRNDLRKFKLQLYFSNKKAGPLLSKSMQVLFLFERIYQHYLKDLNVNFFPVRYKESIYTITDIVVSFTKERALLIEQGHNMSVKEVTRFMQKLFEVHKSNRLFLCWQNFFAFEAYLSIAITAQKAGLTPARFIDRGIKLTNFFHPLIKRPVKNSIDIDKKVIILTGPNMSGKSTLLRSISLSIYLARLGLPVPAEECQVFFADEINVFINSRDDMNGGYSHFMREILNLKECIMAAQEKKQVLAVFDELFSGTNVDDALNILSLTIQGLKKFDHSYFFLSTHLYRIKELHADEMSHAAFYYIDTYLETNEPKFTYQVKEGWSDAKFGSILFKREGLVELLK
jgi:DNA mismatch repair protein MutS